jgi:hypothetical protein
VFVVLHCIFNLQGTRAATYASSLSKCPLVREQCIVLPAPSNGKMSAYAFRAGGLSVRHSKHGMMFGGKPEVAQVANLNTGMVKAQGPCVDGAEDGVTFECKAGADCNVNGDVYTYAPLALVLRVIGGRSIPASACWVPHPENRPKNEEYWAATPSVVCSTRQANNHSRNAIR